MVVAAVKLKEIQEQHRERDIFHASNPDLHPAKRRELTDR